MIIALNIILGSTLLFTFWQDWKFRAVHWLIFPLLAAAAIFPYLLSEGLDWVIVLKNVCFLICVMLCLTLYLIFKTGKMVNLFRHYFGIGDLLFLLAIVPMFGLYNYILFFISGMLISAISHLIVSGKNPIIPLAGYLSLYLLLLKILEWTMNINVFHQNILG